MISPDRRLDIDGLGGSVRDNTKLEVGLNFVFAGYKTSEKYGKGDG